MFYNSFIFIFDYNNLSNILPELLNEESFVDIGKTKEKLYIPSINDSLISKEISDSLQESTYVKGKVYQIPESKLADLDYFIGYPHFYNRKFISIVLDNNEDDFELNVNSYCYFLEKDNN